MCKPGRRYKRDAELAQAARWHIQRYDAAIKELQRRGYTIRQTSPSLAQGGLEVYTMKKESL